jgi:HEPN domain-containing protein
MLKAIVVKRTRNAPPKIHNLKRLAEIGGLELSEDKLNILAALSIHQLEGRYPDLEQAEVNARISHKDLKSAEEMVRWLKNQLQE